MSLRKDFVSWGLILLVLLIVAGGAFYVLLPQLQSHTKLRLGDGVFRAQIADAPSEREKGLSGTQKLSRDEALLFIYDTDGRWGIWMKEMNYAIDIVWLNKNKEVIHIVKNVEPDTYPESFSPNQDARYIVELAAGTADDKKVTIGDKAAFDEHKVEGFW